MAVFNGFYESHGPIPLGDARGIVRAHRHGHHNGQQSGHILHCHFVFCCPGGLWGNTADGGIYWLLWQPWIYSTGQCARYCTIALPWRSKWPATEVHLLVVAASFVWSNVATRPCYDPFKQTPSYFINLIGVISLCVHVQGHPSGGMGSSNPCRWRGKWLQPHGDVVCHVVCAFCAFSYGHHHTLYIDKFGRLISRVWQSGSPRGQALSFSTLVQVTAFSDCTDTYSKSFWQKRTFDWAKMPIWWAPNAQVVLPMPR